MTIVFALFALDFIGSIAGIYLLQFRKLSQTFITASGGVMLGVAAFWIWPDLSEAAGPAKSVWMVLLFCALLTAFDRYVYPVCPCCTAGHEHHAHACQSSAPSGAPIVLAILLHNVFDGFFAGRMNGLNFHSQSGIAVGLFVHKIPEAVLFGMMLRSSSKYLRTSVWKVILAAIGILLGGASALLAPGQSSPWALALFLAAACGSFLFLGVHTFLRQQAATGSRSALMSAGMGIVCTVFLEFLVAAPVARLL